MEQMYQKHSIWRQAWFWRSAFINLLRIVRNRYLDGSDVGTGTDGSLRVCGMLVGVPPMDGNPENEMESSNGEKSVI